MKKLKLNLNGAKALSKNEQRQINGGEYELCTAAFERCNEAHPTSWPDFKECMFIAAC